MADSHPSPSPLAIAFDCDDEYRAGLIRLAARELHLVILDDSVSRFIVHVQDAEEAYRFGLAAGFALNGEEKP